jgi:hypothetical protein
VTLVTRLVSRPRNVADPWRGGFASAHCGKSSRTLGDVGQDHDRHWKQPDGKMRVTSGSWDGEKVFLKDQVIEIRHANADSRLHVARKTRHAVEWDPADRTL